jgi:FAD/FMN-containing dehydrogenase
MMTISNWNGSARFTPAKDATPRDLDELVRIVRDPVTYPSPLRALGELHSLNESVVTDGTAVFMKDFDKISEPANGRVTVGAGVRMIDLKNALKKHRQQLGVVPEIGNATAGSVACCGTKDSSLGREGFGQISSTVVAVRMVTADGRDVTVTDEDELRIIRSSYGLLGIIHEVTFAVEERQKVRYEYRRLKLDAWLKAGRPLPPPDGPEILGAADGFLGFLLPYRRELIVERRRRAGRKASIMALDLLKLWLRTLAWMSGARPFNAPLQFLPRRPRHAIIAAWIRTLDRGFLRWFFLALLGRFEGYRADAMIDFKRQASSYFDFTFWAFPVRTWQTAVPAYLEFCERFRRETGFRPALPTEVYFIRKDDSALLSFSADEDIFTLDMVNWTDEEPARWRQMNRAFNEFAARYGARPLLNQTKELLPGVAKSVWTSGWHRLAAERRARDPHERFLTPFFKGLLP